LLKIDPFPLRLSVRS